MNDNLTYYFDTNALIKYYLNEIGSLKIRQLVSNVAATTLISPVTLLEFIDHIVYHWRSNNISPDDARAILLRLRRDHSSNPNTSRPFLLTSPPSYPLYNRAEEFLLRYAAPQAHVKRGQTIFDKGRKIGAKDMLHIAIAEKLQIYNSVIMVTSDNNVKLICEHLSICYLDVEVV